MICNKCHGHGNHGIEPETGKEFICYACGGTGERQKKEPRNGCFHRWFYMDAGYHLCLTCGGVVEANK